MYRLEQTHHRRKGKHANSTNLKVRKNTWKNRWYVEALFHTNTQWELRASKKTDKQSTGSKYKTYIPSQSFKFWLKEALNLLWCQSISNDKLRLLRLWWLVLTMMFLFILNESHRRLRTTSARGLWLSKSTRYLTKSSRFGNGDDRNG